MPSPKAVEVAIAQILSKTKNSKKSKKKKTAHRKKPSTKKTSRAIYAKQSFAYSTRSKLRPSSQKKLEKALKKLRVNSSHLKRIKLDLPKMPHIKRKGFKQGSKGRTFYINFVAPTKTDNDSNIKDYLARVNSLPVERKEVPIQTKKFKQESKNDDENAKYIDLQFGDKCVFQINENHFKDMFKLKDIMPAEDKFPGWFRATKIINESEKESRMLKISIHQAEENSEQTICGDFSAIPQHMNDIDIVKFLTPKKTFSLQTDPKKILQIEEMQDFDFITGAQIMDRANATDDDGIQKHKDCHYFLYYLNAKDYKINPLKEFAHVEDKENPIRIINPNSIFKSTINENFKMA